MATLFSHISLETLRKEWTKFGGDGAAIARALNDGINKPIKAKWFYDKLTKLVNASFKDYMKKVGAKGVKGVDGEPSTSPPDWILGQAGTFSTSGSFDVPNDQPKGGNFSVSAEDLIAFMSTTDTETRAKQIIEWGSAGLSSLICNDPTGATKVVCGAIGKEQVGDIIYTFWSWIKFGLAKIFANANAPQFTPLSQSDCNEFVKRWKDKIGQTGLVQAFDPSKGTGVVVSMEINDKVNPSQGYKSTTPDQTITWTKQESETIIRNMYFHTTPESKKFIAEACKQYGLCPDLVALNAPQEAAATQAGFGGWIAVGAIALLALGAMNKKR